jgi:hypothetical protein
VKACITKIIAEWNLIVHTHDVNNPSVSTAFLALATRSNYPVTLLGQLHDIPSATASFVLAMDECAESAVRIRSETGIVVNDV